MNATETIEQLRSQFPIFQSTHTGRYGWLRVNGCANLNADFFSTKAGAEADRDQYLQKHGREGLSR